MSDPAFERVVESRSNLGRDGKQIKDDPGGARRGRPDRISDRLLHRCANSQQATGDPAAAEFATALHNKVTADAMMAHLSKLQDIANANNGTRAVGTPGYEASVDYVVNALRNSGFDVQTPEFSARVFHGDKPAVTVGGTTVEARALDFSLGTPPDGVSGPLVAAPAG